MNCQECEPLLIDQAQGTEEHVNTCPSCQEFKNLLDSLQELKKVPVHDPGETYFSTLLQRTRHRIKEQKTPPLWERFSSFFNAPALAFSLAMAIVIVVLAVNQIEDISIFQQKNIYGALAKELIKGDSHDASLDTDFIWDGINELNDQEFQELIQNLDESSLEAAQGAS